MTHQSLRTRRSLADIQADYDGGETLELETLVRAWRGIQQLPATDPQSFFMLGGFHGEPFRDQGATNSAWWGGYCQHGTVHFPTWHRAYLYTLEKALQSVPGCASVMLPFWDETSATSLADGIPGALTDETFVLDGEVIANPLRSYRFPIAIDDAVVGDNQIYSKPAGYETVRYPLSGLVGTTQDQATTAAHNAKFPDEATRLQFLNGNVTDWLNRSVPLQPSTPPIGVQGRVHQKYVACLDAPTYTLFSNTTSAHAWNVANPHELVTALESPHNSIHLAIGGFDLNNTVLSSARGANGDMGENDTAGLDPIFYFHHCFIDYTFWTWQKRNAATDTFTIDASDPGASYVLGGSNQPPAGADPDAPITMDTPLIPFTKDGADFTAHDLINIETQLGYEYGPGSLDVYAERSLTVGARGDRATLHISGLDRARIPGSFLITVYTGEEGSEQQELVGHEAILSRWHVEGCANCQTHLRVAAHLDLPAELAGAADLRVAVVTHDGLFGDTPRPPRRDDEPAPLEADPPFTVEFV